MRIGGRSETIVCAIFLTSRASTPDRVLALWLRNFAVLRVCDTIRAA